MGAHKPRHIRDIAHLYLSRLDPPARDGGRCVVVAGVDRECFPAFHVANMAAALAGRGHAVRLAELSAEPLNTGFFLSLPPAVYIDPPSDGVGVSALGRVTLVHALARETSEAGRIDLVHLPPVAAATHGAVLQRVMDATGASVTLLYLSAGDDPLPEPPEGAGICAVDVRGPRRDGPPRNEQPDGVVWLGRIDRWHSALCDPIPPVIRDPHSMLARSYQSLCESLIQVQRSQYEEPAGPRRNVRAYRRTRSGSFRSR